MWRKRWNRVLVVLSLVASLGLGGLAQHSGLTDIQGYFEIPVAPDKAITGTLNDCSTGRPLQLIQVTVTPLGPLDIGTLVRVEVLGYQAGTFPIRTMASSWGPGGSYITYNLEDICLNPSGPGGWQLVQLPRVDCGQVPVGTTKTITYTFQNPLLEQITINTIGFHDGTTFWEQDPPHPAAAVFAISGHVLPATLNPGESYQFQISFTPPSPGAHQPGNPLTLCVTTTLTGQHIHYIVPLTGTGTTAIPPLGVVHGLVHVPNRGVVVIFEVPSGRLIGEVDLQALSTGGPWPIAVTPDGTYGLINVPNRGVVVIFKISTANLVAEVKLGYLMTGPSPIAITPDGQHGLIYMFNRGTVVMFAIPSGTVEQQVNLGAIATGLPLHTVPLHRLWTGLSPIVLTPDGRYGLIHVPNAMVVKIFEVSTGAVVGDVTLQAYASEPAPLAITPDSHYGLIHVANRGVITIFEIPSGNVVAEVPLRALLQVPSPVILVW